MGCDGATFLQRKGCPRRFTTASSAGVFNRILAELAASGDASDRLMINATQLKVHRTAAVLLKKGLYPGVSGAAVASQPQSYTSHAMAAAAPSVRR
jgi:hypothetical protein